MAISPKNLYPSRVIDGDGAYPYGKALNVQNGVEGTGTPLEAEWLNDIWGSQQALLAEAGISPNGQPDSVGNSQYLDALKKLIREPLELKIFQSPSSGGLTEIQTRTVNGGEVYEVRKTSDDSLATIYSDAAGTTEIVQNGTSNVSDSAGVVEFFVADGYYYVEVNEVSSGISIGSKPSVEQGENNGGVYLILDDANATTLNDILPVVGGRGFKFGIAPYLFGISSSYNLVRLSQLINNKQGNNGEILSHSSYHVSHNASLPLSTGNAYISAAARQFNQYGFNVNGFVAPNSVLDSKFLPVLQQEHDYAFVRSVGNTTNEAATNDSKDDVYNMVRVSLEAITEVQAQAYVDYAVANSKYLVFYTHANVAYLSNLITYIQNSGAANLNPAEWVGRSKGLTKGYNPTASKNLLQNTELKKVIAADTNPYNWTTDFTDIPSATLSVIEGTPARFDLNATATAANETLFIRQNINTGAINRYKPFCFSGRFTSSNDNAQLKVAIYLKDATNTTIISAQKTIDLDLGEQFVEVAEGFIPNASASYIQVELSLTSKAAGQIRCLGVGLKAEYSGKATQFNDVEASTKGYYNVLRRTIGLTVPQNTDTVVVFNASLDGTNRIADLATGAITPEFGIYDLSANFGFKSMVAGDSVTMFLYIDGTVQRKAMFTCVAGDNIFNPCWTIRGDGREYKIGVNHNSSAGRAITTYSDATLTITGK
tara:strand:+ start:27499 stop:29634 length:2136 start_codon:yes stop_codon:yes gene_type:complete